jgi:SOS-response transcriptional repressor LexA
MDIGGCGSSEPFALRVLGDSMAPEFYDGCVIVIDPSGVVENGSYVFAVYENEYIFRQLVIDDGRYFLKPLNEGYETLEIPSTDAIQGVIVQRAGTRRHQRKHYI